MKITLNCFPIVTPYDIRWVNLAVHLNNGIVVKVLNVEITKAKEWLKESKYNIVVDYEGETIELEPLVYFYSDLFINNSDAQCELIEYALTSKLIEILK